LDLSIGATGVQLNTESLVTMLVGGISFDVPSYLETGEPAAADQVFNLYENYVASQEKTYLVKNYWVLYFEGSVRGLSPGAPVEFRGIKIGKVVDINLEFNPVDRDFRIPVLVEIETERFIPTVEIDREEKHRGVLDFLVAKGFRGQLKIGNLITGRQLVSFDIFPDAPRRQIAWNDPYPEFPTVPTPIEEIGSQVSRILTKLDSMPLDEIGKDLHDTVASTKKLMGAPELTEAARNLNGILRETQQLVGELRTGITPDISATLAQAKQSLAAVETTLNEDSPLQVNINSALVELIAAARSLRALTDYLERHPEALIYGKKKDR
jgi:paraquat-inducible protein B